MSISNALKNPAIKINQIEKQAGIYKGTIRNGKYPKEKEQELIRVIGNMIKTLSKDIDLKHQEIEVKPVEQPKPVVPEYIYHNRGICVFDNGLFRRVDFAEGTKLMEVIGEENILKL